VFEDEVHHHPHSKPHTLSSVVMIIKKPWLYPELENEDPDDDYRIPWESLSENVPLLVMTHALTVIRPPGDYRSTSRLRSTERCFR
jgi:hypothetical protein